jgi:1-acyl-sn-glycerol-3-phosphate acyltransferase
VHSTLFGPIKYAILPQTLRESELVGGNGLVEMGTSMAILLGMLLGGSLIEAAGPNGPAYAATAVIIIAVLGYLVCRAIPVAPAAAPELKFNWNFFSETWRVVSFTARDRTVFNAVLGISWFWFFGLVFTAQLPVYTTVYLGGTGAVYILALALFSIGTGIGSMLCERLSGHKVEIGLVPFGSIGLTLFAIDLWLASRGMNASGTSGVTAFLAVSAHWRIAIDIVLLGVFGGFYTVPLYALIQSRSQPSHRSRIIAANNILNALFIVVSAIVAIGLLQAGVSIPQLFLVVGVMNALVAAYIYTLVPEFLMRFLAWLLVHTFYRVRVEGLENIPDDGPCVVVCNHVSYVDAVVIAACVRRPIRFVMDHRIFRFPLLSYIFNVMRAIPIAPAREDAAMKDRAFAEVAAALAAGEVVGIFPEGEITRTGDIKPFRPGIQQILATTPVPVVPMALRGLWGSLLSRSQGGAVHRFRGIFSRIALVAAPAVRAGEATADALFARVSALRGDVR